MEVKVNTRAIVVIMLINAILAGGYFYLKSTAEVRKYKKETQQLRLIEEHQRLEISVIKQKATLEAINKAAQAATPTLDVAPIEPEAKRQAIKQVTE